jgi:hypothetical protein
MKTRNFHHEIYERRKTVNRMDRMCRIKKMDKGCFWAWFYPEYPAHPV